MTDDVLLGYEVGSGAEVRIPVRHMVVTGQTQEAGKTTALEALIARSQVRALCFVTKRGEGAFTGARRTNPYFREQADWQFVASILEASRGEKLKFERAWIIRASRGAMTLADVQENVVKAMETAKGMSADVYLTLNAYLEVVVPQIASVQWATSVDLGAGVNAMDMTDLASEMQHLVIRSSLDWILNRERGTVVVVPEAWKFIPQGRGTPVKLGAEAFIRQGAGLKNYLWLDSQDIAGVDKTILKNVPVWILGVQRESNEIKRTLDQIPAGIKKPKPDQVATLGLGEFFACWGSRVVKTYVQPVWTSAATAVAIARGQMPVIVRGDKIKERVMPSDNVDTRLDRIEGSIDKLVGAMGRAFRPNSEVAGAAQAFRDVTVPVPDRHAPVHREPVPPPAPPPSTRNHGVLPPDEESQYCRFKERLIAEAPALIRLLVNEPEIEIKIERRTVQCDQTSMMGMLATLLHEGYFDKAPVKSGTAHKETKRRWGYGGAPVRTYEKMEELLSLGFFTKEADGYQAVVGIKGRIKTS